MPDMGAAACCSGGAPTDAHATGPAETTDNGFGMGAGAEAEHSQRVVVYLGASQPVHSTHTRMIRALLDQGHHRVFVFLLRWRPERFGTSASSGAAQLRKWLAALPPADWTRFELVVLCAPRSRD